VAREEPLRSADMATVLALRGVGGRRSGRPWSDTRTKCAVTTDIVVKS
jgi:hypothetical protein